MVKTRQQIADEYGISPRTLARWIEKAELDIPSGLLSPRTQFIIYSRFGFPSLSDNVRNLPNMSESCLPKYKVNS